MNTEPYIVRTQFTAHDGQLHPECDNAEYLEYKHVTSGLSDAVCAYGYQRHSGTFYAWIPLTEVRQLLSQDVGASK